MPDVKRLSPDKRKKLLGCVKGKNQAWSKKHNGKKVPARVSRNHYRQCSREQGYD